MTQFMTEMFASGRVVDAILALVVLEALLLVGWDRLAPARVALSPLLMGLLPGVLLLLALREALRGAPWPAIASCLAIAFVAHLADLGLRLARR